MLKGVIDEIASPLASKLVVVPSNPLALDAQGQVVRLLPRGQSSGEVVAEGFRQERAWRWSLGSLEGDGLPCSRV